MSFSKGLDQTWFNLWLKEDGYSMDLYQDVVDDEGPDTELSWTVDIDDENEWDMLFVSGNGKFPAGGLMDKVIEAIRAKEPTFAKCLADFR